MVRQVVGLISMGLVACSLVAQGSDLTEDKKIEREVQALYVRQQAAKRRVLALSSKGASGMSALVAALSDKETTLSAFEALQASALRYTKELIRELESTTGSQRECLLFILATCGKEASGAVPAVVNSLLKDRYFRIEATEDLMRLLSVIDKELKETRQLLEKPGQSPVRTKVILGLINELFPKKVRND